MARSALPVRDYLNPLLDRPKVDVYAEGDALGPSGLLGRFRFVMKVIDGLIGVHVEEGTSVGSPFFR